MRGKQTKILTALLALLLLTATWLAAGCATPQIDRETGRHVTPRDRSD